MPILIPGATYRPLEPVQRQAAMSRHDVVCLHTMVGYLYSTDSFFMQNGWGGTESHIGIGGKWSKDPTLGLNGKSYQWQDLRYVADANLDGNPRVISIETADNAPLSPDDIEEWGPEQLAEIIRVVTILCKPHKALGCPSTWRCYSEGIPPVLIPDTQSHRRGIGYHAQGAADHTIGEWWSVSHTKPCPTRRRIAQLETIVIPQVVRNLSGGDSDMTVDEFKRALREEFGADPDGNPSLRTALYLLGVREINSALGDNSGGAAIDTSAIGVGSPARVGIDQIIEGSSAVAAVKADVDALHTHLDSVDAKLDRIIAYVSASATP